MLACAALVIAGCGGGDTAGDVDTSPEAVAASVELATASGDGFTATVTGPDPADATCPTLDSARSLSVELATGDGELTVVALEALDPGALPTGARIERTPEVLVQVGPMGLFVAVAPVLAPADGCFDGELSSIEQALLDEHPRPAAVGVSPDGVVTEIELPVDPTTWNVLPDAHVIAAAAWVDGELPDVVTPADG